MDFDTLNSLRNNHPAWQLLLADHAPLAASFLHKAFILPNVRGMSQAELVSKLEDVLFSLRESSEEELFSKNASHFLNYWAQENRGWLRKYYPSDSDEPHYDLTPASEKAILWLESLTSRSFVGTESRLMTVFELLRQMVEGSDDNAEARIEELERKKRDIDAEIERIQRGEFSVLDETALKDRFQQVSSTARELLSDFREVEQNFRSLDRNTREHIANWEGAKGGLLQSIFQERDAIADSDQGRNFKAFWDFLMSPERQEELSTLLQAVFELEAVRSFHPDPRLKNVHYDWLEAGEHTQRTVSLLSQQLRRFLDDKVWLENKRIMEIIHRIETSAIALRDNIPKDLDFMELDDTAASVAMPMDRPLHTVPLRPVISDEIGVETDEGLATDALFQHVVVDKGRLSANIRHALQSRNQVSLIELLEKYPLDKGLAELVTYLAIASDDKKALFDEGHYDQVEWIDENETIRTGKLPRVIFNR